jgi:hypothetical protein
MFNLQLYRAWPVNDMNVESPPADVVENIMEMESESSSIRQLVSLFPPSTMLVGCVNVTSFVYCVCCRLTGGVNNSLGLMSYISSLDLSNNRLVPMTPAVCLVSNSQGSVSDGFFKLSCILIPYLPPNSWQFQQNWADL